MTNFKNCKYIFSKLQSSMTAQYSETDSRIKEWHLLQFLLVLVKEIHGVKCIFRPV